MTEHNIGSTTCDRDRLQRLLLSLPIRGVFLMFHLMSATCGEESNVQVPTPPLITVQPFPEYTFILGQTFTMHCAASGHPPPTYTWTIDDRPIGVSGTNTRLSMSNGSGYLEITSAKASDEGTYRCWAENSGGRTRSIAANTRMAYLKPFAKKTGVTLRPVVGRDHVLRCDPPPSNPPALVRWGTLSGNNEINPIDTPGRIIQSLEGDLYFTHVEESDSATYLCTASNMMIRSMSNGPKFELQPELIRNYQFEPSLLWKSDTKQEGVAGKDIRFQCIFRGSPTPAVIWDRQDLDLPQDRWFTEDHGSTLVIRSLQPDDEGVYLCIGHNDFSTEQIESSFTLNVAQVPEFVESLQSVNSTEGATVNFSCKATAHPDPKYAWILNGIDLNSANIGEKYQTSPPSTLKISKLSLNDTMIIGCGVSNKYGHVNASAYLRVMPGSQDMHQTVSYRPISGDAQHMMPYIAMSGFLVIFALCFQH